MASKGVIIGRKEGQTVPDEVLDLAIAEHGQYIGMCWPERDDEGRVSIGSTTVTGSPDEMKKTIKDTLDEVSIPFWMYHGSGDTDTDGQQPFFLSANADSEPLIAVMLEGDWSTAFHVPNSSYSAAYHICDRYLRSKIGDMLADMDNDLAKVAAKLERPTTQQEILLVCCPSTGRCEIRIMFANGNEIMLSQGNLNRSFDWGDMSQNLGFGDAPEPVAVSPPEPPKRGAISLGGKKSTPIPAATSVPSVTAKVTGDTAVGAALQAAKVSKAVEEKAKVMVIPPKHKCGTKKDMEGWYRHWAGYLPKGWEQTIGKYHETYPVEVKETLLKNMVDFEKAVRAGTVDVYEPAIRTAALAGVKTSTPAASGDAASTIQFVLPAEERQKIELWNNKIIKTRGDNGKLIVDYAALSEELRRFATASEELGWTEGIKRLDQYTHDEIILMCQTSPLVAAKVIAELRYALRHAGSGSAVAAGKVAI